MEHSPSTLKPDPYAETRGYVLYEGHDLTLADMDTVWAIGATPEDAIVAFCKARLTEPGPDHPPTDLESGGTQFTWGRRFVCNGTGFKAAGIHVPGGVVMTWWS